MSLLFWQCLFQHIQLWTLICCYTLELRQIQVQESKTRLDMKKNGYITNWTQVFRFRDIDRTQHLIGTYYVQTKYYGYAGSSLPSADNCVKFAAEFAIIPTSYMDSITSITQSCTTTKPPSTIEMATYEKTFQRSMNSQA
jgi:hypothetical protein